MKALVICSGGLDSATLAYRYAEQKSLSLLLSFNYGQRHLKEVDCAAAIAARLGVAHRIIDISAVGKHLTGSALTDDVDVPHGHYAAETMAITIVPNRNAIMLAIAFGVASANQCDIVAAAVHGGDHFIYPDCRPEFIQQFQTMQNHALEGVSEIQLDAPYLKFDKAAIVSEGDRLGVPFAQTWSCYQGGEIHCGRCGTCVERQEAFALAGVVDPTPYQDGEYWQTVTRA